MNAGTEEPRGLARLRGLVTAPFTARDAGQVLYLTALFLGVLTIGLTFLPDVAHAEFPIPGWDNMVEDVHEVAVDQGGTIGTAMGCMVGAGKLILSSGEYGFA